MRRDSLRPAARLVQVGRDLGGPHVEHGADLGQTPARDKDVEAGEDHRTPDHLGEQQPVGKIKLRHGVGMRRAPPDQGERGGKG